VDVKVGSNLILAGARCGRVGGYRVSHKSKAIFWNVAYVTGEYFWNFTKFIRNIELTLSSIINWDCTLYMWGKSRRKREVI
jgi:hypothetical protein